MDSAITAADVVAFTNNKRSVLSPDYLSVLVIRRGWDPFEGRMALPGGGVDRDERFRAAAARELREETGLHVPEQSLRLLTLGDEPGRDPRGRVVSAVFYTVVPDAPPVRGGDDAKEAWWAPVSEVRADGMAFDHLEFVEMALREAFPQKV